MSTAAETAVRSYRDASRAYRARRADISQRIARVELALMEHNRRGPKTWAHVGDLGHVAERLGEIEEFLGVPDSLSLHRPACGFEIVPRSAFRGAKLCALPNGHTGYHNSER